jgi:hypothetical protein
MKRHSDGRWRNTRVAVLVSEAILRPRWAEAETISLKKMGLSFDSIAEQLSRFGRGLAAPIVALPEGLKFPSDYSISRQACHKAFRKAIAREPALAIDELRKLDNSRSEELYLNLQPAIGRAMFGRSRSRRRYSATWLAPTVTPRRRSTRSPAKTASLSL